VFEFSPGSEYMKLGKLGSFRFKDLA